MITNDNKLDPNDIEKNMIAIKENYLKRIERLKNIDNAKPKNFIPYVEKFEPEIISKEYFGEKSFFWNDVTETKTTKVDIIEKID